MTGPELAAIVKRDRLGIHGDDDTPEHMQATTDRGELLILLRETREALVFVLMATHPIDGAFSAMPVSNVESVYRRITPAIDATAELAEP